ncbi:hypothetical protein LJC19_07205 [Oxalobacter sp. OttesenSCG-928-P03]|nr:hypothetical protein [Oxalobacter sp. OttesenSCG-928-P03]
MKHDENGNPVAAGTTRVDDSALDFCGESEGGFPCGEFCWDDEMDATPVLPPAKDK